MNNKRVLVMYGLPEGRVLAFTSVGVAENYMNLELGIDNKTEIAPGVWSFGKGSKKYVLKSQELFGSNDLCK